MLPSPHPCARLGSRVRALSLRCASAHAPERLATCVRDSFGKHTRKARPSEQFDPCWSAHRHFLQYAPDALSARRISPVRGPGIPQAMGGKLHDVERSAYARRKWIAPMRSSSRCVRSSASASSTQLGGKGSSILSPAGGLQVAGFNVSLDRPGVCVAIVSRALLTNRACPAPLNDSVHDLSCQVPSDAAQVKQGGGGVERWVLRSKLILHLHHSPYARCCLTPSRMTGGRLKSTLSPPSPTLPV